MNEPLDYQTPQPQARISAIAVVAFLSSLISCPCLHFLPRTRPFWTGHPLWKVGKVIDSVPSLPMPVVSLALAVIALKWIRESERQLKGRDLAIAAIVLSSMWILIVTVGAWVAEQIIPVPHPD